jgi:uncharacterized protein (DUF1800 family)
MIDQNVLLRSHALGSFKNLVSQMTQNEAMVVWLDCWRNRKGAVNENYGRELMELFTLGAGRGAYTERDVREVARALSGWQCQFVDELGFVGKAYYDASKHDDGTKTIFGQTGNFDWTDVCRMVVEHPKHPGFFVEKLWSYFILEPVPDAVRVALEQAYVASGHQIRPVLEAILCSPQFYEGARMVKPPVVYHAGMMRARQRYVTRTDWYWYSMMAGQRLFWPPDVSGWNDRRWLDTNTALMRWSLAGQVFLGDTFGGTQATSYDADETPEEAVDAALALWANPTISAATRAALVSFAKKYEGSSLVKAERQNVLRQLIPNLPDYHTC